MQTILWLSYAAAATLTVDGSGGGTYDTIQDAVDVAKNGDRIDIAPGSYFECVDLLGKDLALRGTSGSGVTEIAAGGSCAVALLIDSGSSATITGLTVSNPGYQGMVIDTAESEMSDVVVADSGGSKVSEGGGAYIVDSIVSCDGCTFAEDSADAGGALYVVSSELTLTDFSVTGGSGDQWSVILAEATTAWLEDGEVSDNATGAGLEVGPNTTVQSTRVKYAGNAGSGVYVRGSLTSKGDSVTDNGGRGVDVAKGAWFSLEDGEISGQVQDYGGGMYVYDGGSARLTNTTMSKNGGNVNGGAIYLESTGALGLDSVTFSGNEAGNMGAALSAEPDADVQIDDSTFTDNQSFTGQGGAIYMAGTNTLTIRGSRFERNIAWSDYGGAISMEYGTTLSITDTEFVENQASDTGGAVDSGSSATTITACTFTGNTSDGGGGAIATNTRLTIHDSTFTENKSARQGGAISGGSVAIDDSTFRGNEAYGEGGAISATGSTPVVSLENCEFIDNVAGASGERSTPKARPACPWCGAASGATLRRATPTEARRPSTR